VTRLEVGYFSEGSSEISGGTKASTAGAILQPSFAFRRGRLHRERTGARVHRFRLSDGSVLQGISVGAPSTSPCTPYTRSCAPSTCCWVARVRWVADPALTAGVSVVSKIPGAGAKLYAALGSEGSTGGPDDASRSGSRSLIVADARSESGELIHRVVLRGPNGTTSPPASWPGPQRRTRGAISRTGALGPVDAFGLDALRTAAEDAGLRQA